MKIKLNLNERLMFLNLLPKENNFAILGIIRTVSEEVRVTDNEYIEFEIKEEPNGQISWHPEKGKVEKEFKIGQVAELLIIKELKKLDQENKLVQSQLSLYEKFVENVSS